MHLKRLYIRNYRSIKELDLLFDRGKNVIVGRNSAGKSNIVRAVDLVLGEAHPSYSKSENITANDFHTWKEGRDGALQSADELVVCCELCRDPGELLDYEEIARCAGYRLFGSPADPMRVLTNDPSELCEAAFGLKEEQNRGLWVNPKNRSAIEGQLADKYCFAFAVRARRAQDGRVTKDIRFMCREDAAAGWLVTDRAPIRTELLQSAIMPSFRDPHQQLRLSSWTWYGKLMRHLTDGHGDSPQLRQALRAVKDVADGIFEGVRQTVAESALSVAFPGADLHFQFNADSQLDLYKTCQIYIDDGFKSPLIEKGAGIQSATLIGLFNYYTRHVNTVASALLCIEEPELYLHPHARRVISDRLDDFMDGNRHQIVLTTHSPEFLRTTAQGFNIVLVSRDAAGTRAASINAREFQNLLLDGNQNELFFAEKVIICEGYDHCVVRAAADSLCRGALNAQNVSIVAVSGKNNIARLAGAVVRLGIECYVVADFDYLLRDKSENRKKYGDDVKAHDSIVQLGTQFFGQDCIWGKQGGKILGLLEQLRTELKKENEEAFYLAKRATVFANPRLDKALWQLRSHGVCILSGEIEDCCRDNSFLRPGTTKLSLEKASELGARLDGGERISDIFDVSEIEPFLAHVLGGPPRVGANRIAAVGGRESPELAGTAAEGAR